MKAYRDKTEDLDQLYEKNVRRFLGVRGKVNRGVQDTLKSAPEQFGLYNNGHHHSRDKLRGNRGKEFRFGGTLHRQRMPNNTNDLGGLRHTRLEAGGTGDNPELEAWRKRVEQGVVVTKIVKVGNEGEKLLEAITRYTNTQNAIREKDFLALTSDFKTWAHQMAERYDVFLEIQRGSWNSRRALERQKPDLHQFKQMANAFDLLKVYGAGWLGEAGVAFGKNAPFLPNGSIFRKIVNEEGVVEGEPFGVKTPIYTPPICCKTLQTNMNSDAERRRTFAGRPVSSTIW